MTALMPEIYQPTIRELPKGKRPRERLREYGPRHLNNSELIAILLRTGMQLSLIHISEPTRPY